MNESFLVLFFKKELLAHGFDAAVARKKASTKSASF
jgi:hypothetical protein